MPRQLKGPKVWLGLKWSKLLFMTYSSIKHKQMGEAGTCQSSQTQLQAHIHILQETVSCSFHSVRCTAAEDSKIRSLVAERQGHLVSWHFTCERGWSLIFRKQKTWVISGYRPNTDKKVNYLLFLLSQERGIISMWWKLSLPVPVLQLSLNKQWSLVIRKRGGMNPALRQPQV